MITKEMLESISQGPAIEAASAAAGNTSLDLLALPNNFTLHDVERYAEVRRRARGTMSTPSMTHFAAYVQAHREDGAAVFIDPDAMQAKAVLNLGRPDAPGHADNQAVLAPKKTAAFTALLDLVGASVHGLSQRTLAEFLEDWATVVWCVDSEGGQLELKRSVDAVRRITIDSARSVESEERSLSAQRSVMESLAVHSKAAPIPAVISFHCEPYAGLVERKFDMRISVRTGDAAKPTLTLALHIIRWEEHAEAMAQELASKVTDLLDGETEGDVAVYLGSYKA